MTVLALLFALLLTVAAMLWLMSRGTGATRVSQQANTTTPYRLKRLWWPGIVTRPG